MRKRMDESFRLLKKADDVNSQNVWPCAVESRLESKKTFVQLSLNNMSDG